VGVVGRLAVELGGVTGAVEAFGEALGYEFELVGGVGQRATMRARSTRMALLRSWILSG
jgi:hypothetical protein